MVVRVRITSIRGDRLLEVLYGLTQLTNLPITNSEVEQCLVRCRELPDDCCLEAVDGLVELFQIDVDQRPFEMVFRLVLLDLQRVIIVFQRLLHPA